MAYFEIPENPNYDDKIEKLTPETRNHADVWNVIYQRIIENIAYIHNAVNVLKGNGDGSVIKLIAEEVAKIIADAPEDFDTLKEISDWIENHQDSAAAMNTEIADLKRNKLGKSEMAESAAVAGHLRALRSDSDLDTDVFENESIWIREQKPDSPNIPSEHLYHVINIVGMGRNRTQLALGVTTSNVFYRSRNSLSSWDAWKKIPLITDGIYDDVLTLKNILRVGKPDNAPFGVELAYNNEGGNVSWYSPDGTRWEFDTCGDVFRLFNYSTLRNFVIDKNGNVNVGGYISTATNGWNYRICAGNRVAMWSDNEGGNIEIASPNGTMKWQFDCNDSGIMRVYLNANGTNYFPFNVAGSVFTINTALKVGGGEGIYTDKSRIWDDPTSDYTFHLGGIYAKSNNYPHFKVTQFTNSLQVLPTQANTCTLGHTVAPLECITAKNIYNSSGLITSSDRNKKKDFSNITQKFADVIIDGLKPTSFKYKTGNSSRTHYGLIAQDVEKLLEELEIDNTDFAPLIKEYPKKEVKQEDGSISLETDYEAEPEYFLRYEGFIGFIIKYIQGLKQENKELEEKMSKMEDRLTLLENKLNNN